MPEHPLLDHVHLRDARLHVARVDHQAAEREPGVQLDVPGAHHARVLHGALGGREGAGTRFVQAAPGGDHGEHLGVHLRRRQAAHQVLGGGELRPAVPAGLCLHQAGALDPEPGGTEGVVLVLQDAQRPLGDLQGALALPAQPARDGGLGHQVEVAQGGGGRVAATGWEDLHVVDGAQLVPYGFGGGLPQLHRALQEPELLGVGVSAAGLDGGVEDGGERLGGVVRVVPVTGQAGGALVGRDEVGSASRASA
ncbi:hypothetical protein O1M63_36075 [Streptomyces mirabilis]|nr:hypothetical protein [Streptomyces mirabilis]